MQFEWDENKRLINICKHGIDFVDADAIFEWDTITAEDLRFDYGKQRFLIFGILKEHVVAVVHTQRNDVIRIISIRKANKYEKANYSDKITNRWGTNRCND